MSSIDGRLRALEQRIVPETVCPGCADWPVFLLLLPGEPSPPPCPVCHRMRQPFTIKLDRCALARDEPDGGFR